MKRAARGKAAKKASIGGGEEEVNGEEAARLKALVETGNGLGGLSDREVLRVLKADKACEGLYAKACKGKSAGNPNCLCNLIPAPGSFRRQGLWAKEADVVGTLGPDPAARARKDASKPVGLKNLGNTCYVNSVLQCLFASSAFRRAVYAVRQPLADEPIVKELRELFMAMEHGCTDPADPEPLAKALNLDHAVQQDGQEFLKLFLTLLEARFGGQPELEGLIQALFRGKSGYSTTCRACGRQSESSARSDNFYEVDVPVKGYKSLQESLASLLFPEVMDGDNQYHCDFCAKKVDATRQLELRSLPPMLCFSLQRFVFDFQRMDRVKVSDKFAFPLSLDMAPLVGQAGRTDMVYDLEAIMVHKGSSALAGHYVAHIKLEAPPGSSIKQEGGGSGDDGKEAAAAAAPAGGKGGAKKGARGGKKAAAAEPAAAAGGDAAAAGKNVWWRFDDEAATELKGGPTASTDHGGSAAAAAAKSAGDGGKAGSAAGGKKGGRGGGGGAKGKGGRGGGGRGKGRGSKRRAADSENEEEEEGRDEQSAAVGMEMDEEAEMRAAIAASLQQQQPGAGGAAVSSAPQQAQQEQAAQGAQQSGQRDEIVSSNAYLLVYRQRGTELPVVPLDSQQEAALAAAAAQYAEQQAAAVSAWAESKEKLLERQAARQAEVRGVVEAAVKLEDGDPGRFVSADWLDKWAGSGVEAGPTDPIDNAPLLCPHNKLDPGKIAVSRRISTAAWEQLRELCRGGPELGPADTCPTCLVGVLDCIAAKEDTEEQFSRFLAIARVLDEGEGPQQGLSQDFLVSQAWLKDFLKKRAPGTLPTKAPTAAITCPCGGLAPESAKEAKRVAIPADFWAFLQRGWRAQQAERARRAALRAARKPGGAAGAAGGAAGGSGAWEASEGEALRAGASGLAEGEDSEVICLDGAEQAPPAAGRRPKRGRSAAAGSAAAKAGEGDEEEVVEVKEERSDDVVVLDSGGEETGKEAANGGAGGGPGAAEAAGAGSGELKEFPVGTPECPTCAGDLREASRALKGLQGRLQEERQDLAHLLQPQQRQLQPGVSYRLVPSAFMAAWRGYMGQAGKRALGKGATAAAIVQPPSLLEAMEGVLCECHRGGAAPAPAPAPAEEEAAVMQEGAAVKEEAGAAGAAGSDGQPGASRANGHAAHSIKEEEEEDEEEEGGGGSGRLMLAYPPPRVVNKRGRWVADDGSAAAAAAAAGLAAAGAEAVAAADGAGCYELLEEEDWMALAMYYAGGEEGSGRRKRARGAAGARGRLGEQLEELLERGIVARLVVDGSPGGAADQQQPDQPQGEASAANGFSPSAGGSGRPVRGRGAALRAEAAAAAAGDTSGSDGEYMLGSELTVGTSSNPYQLNRKATVRQGAIGAARLETDPPLCQAAVSARAAAVKAARLVYAEEEIMVELVGSAEEAMAAGGDGGAGAERKSKRARKGRAPIRASSSLPLETFRSLIWQELGVHPLNAQLFLRGAPLAGEGSATLAECEVFPGDEIKVVDSGVHDSNDYASILPFSSAAGGKGRRREAERGFTGTALTGLAPVGGGAGAAAGEEQQEGGIDMDAELAAAAAAEEEGGGLGAMAD